MLLSFGPWLVCADCGPFFLSSCVCSMTYTTPSRIEPRGPDCLSFEQMTQVACGEVYPGLHVEKRIAACDRCRTMIETFRRELQRGGN
jgi:hypothetical protein